MNSIITVKKDYLLQCSELYVSVFNAAPWNDKWTEETAYKRLEDIYNCPNFEGVLYVENEDVKGAIFGNYEQFYDGIHYNLREMFTSPELQGKGIGSKMLKSLEVRLKEVGVTEVMLFTGKGDITSKFYIKNGFSEWDSLAIMGKEI